jgi:glycine dehydrogenase subunit 2
MSDLIFELSRKGRVCAELPALDVPLTSIDRDLLRNNDPTLPEIAEIDLVRHYMELSRNAFGVDSGFYPLGSCTMKYNPKIN